MHLLQCKLIPTYHCIHVINHSWCSLQTLKTTWRYLYNYHQVSKYILPWWDQSRPEAWDRDWSGYSLLNHCFPYTMPLLPRKPLKITRKRCMIYLTLISPPHFEDVPCQSGVNHIFEGYENYVSRQGIYHCKEECLSFIKKQTEIQIYK